MNIVHGSWKTTTGGLLTVIIAILGVAQQWFSGKPLDPALMATALSAITSGLGLAFARDNNVTSEKAGAK